MACGGRTIPCIVDTLKVVDRLLKTDTPSGPVWHRYNGDGYGEHEDGSPFDGTGRGRGWPLLTGERGHYALAAGEDPLPYLEAMAAMSSSRRAASRAGLGQRADPGIRTGTRQAERLRHAAGVGAQRIHQAVLQPRAGPSGRSPGRHLDPLSAAARPDIDYDIWGPRYRPRRLRAGNALIRRAQGAGARALGPSTAGTTCGTSTPGTPGSASMRRTFRSRGLTAGRDHSIHFLLARLRKLGRQGLRSADRRLGRRRHDDRNRTERPQRARHRRRLGAGRSDRGVPGAGRRRRRHHLSATSQSAAERIAGAARSFGVKACRASARRRLEASRVATPCSSSGRPASRRPRHPGQQRRHGRARARLRRQRRRGLAPGGRDRPLSAPTTARARRWRACASRGAASSSTPPRCTNSFPGPVTAPTPRQGGRSACSARRWRRKSRPTASA